MKKVIIKNLDGVQTHGAEMEDPTAWVAECVASNAWGLPEEYTVEITDISAEYALAEVIKNRVSEYPSAEEFLNAFFDGGEVALAELQAKRLLVKAKYPKPSEGEE
jgi:hypothetical protein